MEPMDKVKVMVADDHPVVRGGLQLLLNAQPDMEVVGDAGDGQTVLEKLKFCRPDVLMLDISMPEVNGLDVARRVREDFPRVRVVIVSMHDKDVYVRQALESGVFGYVLKGASSSELLEAVRAAGRGDYYLSSRVRADLIQAYLKQPPPQPASHTYDLLSEREQQVFRMLVEGHSTGEIAEQLFVSPKTVEKHRVNVMKKLDCPDLLSMVKFGIRIGIIDPDFWKS
ncbi:DNA-binding response regulator [Desulfuromonas versatilis]|uniref:DNA-binding response regulator n=2 Tax=Desulfuromonas versatilis TaxID=2802975 RepID=A0ABM8I0V3_9BACT|nr:DNA-binding response regulator [Desulfuromonas versatilis]